MTAFYTIVESLSGLSTEELRRLKHAIGIETGVREQRAMVDQLNLTERQQGQSDFENVLIRARGKG